MPSPFRIHFWTAFFFSFFLFISGTQAAPVSGFADLHNHVFAEYAFGGAWLHGTVEGDIAHAMIACDSEPDLFSMKGDHARTIFPIISRFIGKIPGSSGDTGSHPEKTGGYPNFEGWPRWDTVAHEQDWEGYLKTAHEQGLSLIIISAVNFEPLCAIMPAENRKYDCDDMSAVDRQIAAARRFESTHDWFKIVSSPAEARAAIGSGKLAVLLSIEVTELFGHGDWRPELDRIYKAGLRTFQIAHQLNNRFVGAAIHNPIFRIIQWEEDVRHASLKDWLTPWRFGFNMKDNKNQRGLSEEGKDLVREMMKRKMLIDLAHVSEKGVTDVQALTTPTHYPVYISHGHFREAMDDGNFSIWEKSSPPWVLDYIRESGGMFGLRTGPEKTKAFNHSVAPNDCQGSTKSFAQTYQYGTKTEGLSVGFGSDLNGFIQQLRPRFGENRETCGAENNSTLRTIQQRAQKMELGKRFDQSGFGNISQLPDVLQELKNFGVDTTSLEHSSENFIRMWEKADQSQK
jgi:microsomal dipeptidase-like Zn-dependent dipeptidase